ncbi:MAG: Rieske (2Fe-2S) protein [Candidatus Nitrosocaldus sp.]
MLVRVCRLEDVKDESMMLIRVDGREYVVGKHNGRVFACDAHCPHRYAYLHRGHFNGNNIVCPLHGFEFDIDTGRLVKIKPWHNGNNWPEQDPEWYRSDDLRVYRVEVGEDGYIYLHV